MSTALYYRGINLGNYGAYLVGWSEDATAEVSVPFMPTPLMIGGVSGMPIIGAKTLSIELLVGAASSTQLQSNLDLIASTLSPVNGLGNLQFGFHAALPDNQKRYYSAILTGAIKQDRLSATSAHLSFQMFCPYGCAFSSTLQTGNVVAGKFPESGVIYGNMPAPAIITFTPGTSMSGMNLSVADTGRNFSISVSLGVGDSLVIDATTGIVWKNSSDVTMYVSDTAWFPWVACGQQNTITTTAQGTLQCSVRGRFL